MVVLYLWVIGIDVFHVFLDYRYRCWSCICVLLLSMMVMYLCVIGIDVGHLCVYYRYRCWACICGL